VRSQPYAVVLFDELEKAHPAVFDLLLQVLDDGRLTDAQGRTVSFSEAILVFTSNLGADLPDPERQIGLKVGAAPAPDSPSARQALARQVQEALRKHFRPEFLNRLGKIVLFHALGRETARRILDRIVAGANRRLAERRLELVPTAAALDLLLDQGFSARYGARELERTFMRLVNEPLARLLLQAPEQGAARGEAGAAARAIHLDVREGRLEFTWAA
jgi:ATP-dependent Clp protease ATP-binding subunit ClpA